MDQSPVDMTRLLAGVSAGDQEAVSSLFSLVYDELRRVAASTLRRERPDHTLQPTALVHEAYLRLAHESDERWESRAHFLAVAATAMRHVLVDHARGRNAQKRGSGEQRLPLEDVHGAVPSPGQEIDFLALDVALSRLGELDSRQARLVELRFFGGLTVEEAAAVVGVSPRTVKREWQVARAWLKREMARLETAQ
jgi:RNA polymerase sigma-70 factor, ECF subfamily